jgi:hypothetical protein
MKTLNLRKRLLSRKWIPASSLLVLLVLVLGSSTTVLSQGASDDAAVEMIITPQRVRWVPQIEHGGVTLTITGPGGMVNSRTFEPGQVPIFRVTDANGDGSYTYELRILPTGGGAPSQVDDAQRGLADTVGQGAIVLSGGLTILDGEFIVPADEEGASAAAPRSGSALDNAVASYVITQDLVVQGSECVGLDCVNGESFGFDTFRLKENNLRIHFYDTSNSASFPSNDWRITVNDSANGGANHFSIDDATAGRTPFRIMAGARANSIYVDNSGKVGLGTASPALNLHIWNGDTPGIRLAQSGGGWAPQTWDVAGNEANFFVRDVTNGSLLPFRIKPSAPTNSLFVANSGNVGLGTESPSGALDITRTGENVKLILNKTDGDKWVLNNASGGLRIAANDPATAQILIQTNGDLTATGDMNAVAFNPTSDINAKENFGPVDGKEVLAQLEDIEISTWNFKTDEDTVRHMGPTAQEFYAAYGLGKDDKHISTTDADGVALVAIKELNEQNKALKEENAELEARVAALEQAVGLSAGARISLLSLLPWILVGVLLLGFGLMGGYVLASRKQLARAES